MFDKFTKRTLLEIVRYGGLVQFEHIGRVNMYKVTIMLAGCASNGIGDTLEDALLVALAVRDRGESKLLNNGRKTINLETRFESDAWV